MTAAGQGIRWCQGITWFLLRQLLRLQFPQIKTMSPANLAAWLAQSDPNKPLLLDVRTEAEYAVSHLPGAVQINPTTQDFNHLGAIAPETLIVTYCSVGYRSAALAKHLQQAGYQNVVNLEGSIFRWANEHRLVVRQGRPVRQVHPYNRVWGWLLDRGLSALHPD